jgi:hypothetical protein
MNKISKINSKLGFDGRIFLKESEWETYRRRKPVRYLKKPKNNLCEVCHKIATDDNPIQNAHIIGFEIGVICLGLTPEYVDGHDNIVSAHKKKCNKEAELDLLESCRVLKLRGIKSLPEFIPQDIYELWLKV